MKPSFLLLAVTALGIACSPLNAAEKPASKTEAELAKLKTETTESIALFKEVDPTLKKFFDKSAGYVVFPSIGKGGFVIGGAHGKGLVFEKGKLVGQASVSQVTIGAQIGGQVLRELVFFETPEAMERFKRGKVKISAQVSAVAAAEGAGEKARYEESVVVFTRPKEGLMAEASVGGQKFSYTPLK